MLTRSWTVLETCQVGDDYCTMWGADRAFRTLALVPSCSEASQLDTWMSESFDIALDCWSVCLAHSPTGNAKVAEGCKTIFNRSVVSKILLFV